MSPILLPLAILLAITSLLMIGYSIVRLVAFSFRDLFFKVIPSFFVSISCALCSLLCFIALSFYILTSSRAIAVVQTLPVSEQNSVIRLYTSHGDIRQFNVHGDSWQLDVNVVRIKPALRIFGLNALFQFDRLVGRYSDSRDEFLKARSVFDLEPTLSAAGVIHQFQRFFPSGLIDSSYGSSSFVDLGRPEFFIVHLNNEGLYVLPNESGAKTLIKSWRQ